MKLPMQSVADALDLPLPKVERWIRQGRIPLQRSGVDAVFSCAAMEKWAATHHLPFTLDGHPACPHVPEALDSLVAAMQRGQIVRGIAGKDAGSALREAVDRLDFLADEIREELFAKLIERERLATTGIGNGIAIPHSRDPLSQPPMSPVIVTYFPKSPLDFNAIDDKPVFVFFILISPSVKHHLHLLSRLSYCIREKAFVTFLSTHPDAADLYARVAEFEQALDDH